ncbi:hypothetical protein K1T71_007534 [Dendrolimus kikuchii]|uniref:Uncharacterized protein n=1 Tax=Dendrolimus kikuchii TaxID=765133 RepID=A0ACC1CXH8_9NEOP|nr:hypothetical protein K1T71_007534 [Dendrolimus kikuchii]
MFNTPDLCVTIYLCRNGERIQFPAAGRPVVRGYLTTPGLKYVAIATLSCVPALVTRFQSAMDRLGKIWRNRNITKATKMRLLRALVFPIFLYGAETWTIRESERKKIDALEMWSWRRMLRLAWTQFRTNVSILEELDIKQRLSSIVQGRILTFFGHITRREDTSVERLTMTRHSLHGPQEMP